MTIRINLEPSKEREFRSRAMEKYGFKKGAISKALEDAIDIWLSMDQNKLPIISNPTKALVGMLKDVKETSVELQHLGKNLFIKAN